METTDPTDERLMERAARGDGAAFGRLFDRHQPRLVAFLARFTGANRAVAEDVAQEAFGKVWEARASFDPSRATFRAFLYVAAKNLARSEMAGARRRRTLPLDAAPEQAAPGDGGGGDPSRESERDILRCAVRKALAGLPEEQRLCVLLREYDGCSFRETASVLGCSEVRARVLAFRARAYLKRRLMPFMESEASDDEKK